MEGEERREEREGKSERRKGTKPGGEDGCQPAEKRKRRRGEESRGHIWGEDVAFALVHTPDECTSLTTPDPPTTPTPLPPRWAERTRGGGGREGQGGALWAERGGAQGPSRWVPPVAAAWQRGVQTHSNTVKFDLHLRADWLLRPASCSVMGDQSPVREHWYI